MTEKMEYYEVAGFTATWGSYMTAGDPGACMYGFDDTGRPQTENHKADSIAWLEGCKLNVLADPENFTDEETGQDADDELEKIARCIAFLKDANPLDGGTRSLSNLKDEFRLTGDGDDWGNAMSWWFAVALEMNDRGMTIPDDWKFRAGAGRSDAETLEGEACQQAEETALEEFGALLDRYVRYLKFKGKDY